MIRTLKIIIGIIILAVFAFGIYSIWQKFAKKPAVYVNLNQAAVIKEMRQLERLETASFTIEKIVDAGVDQGGVLKDFLFGDKLLLIAHAEVIAGFDLSSLKESDIKVVENKLTLTLPKAQILFTRLDNEKTRVYDRTTGIFSQGNKDLESQAREQAELSIRRAACEGNILRTATENGRNQLTTLFKSIGFEEVTIIIPEGNCE